MNQFYRKNIDYINEDLIFQNISWEEIDELISGNESEDEELDNNINNEEYVIKVFGVTDEGYSVCLNIEGFTPFFYIKLPNNYNSYQIKDLLHKISKKLVIKKDSRWIKCWNNLLIDKCNIHKKKDFYGFHHNDEFKFLRLTFNNKAAMKRCVNVIKNHNNGSSLIGDSLEVEYPIYEGNIDPMIKFTHIRNISFSGWLKVPRVKYIDFVDLKSNTQIEAKCKWTDVLPFDKVTNAPLLQASFDIETYSHDGLFPKPNIKENVIFQIATAFKYTGQSDFYLKHIICLKKSAPLQNQSDNLPTVLECYDTESEVLLAWATLIKNMDPDILYSYNGSGFDDKYIATRVKILNIDDFFENISRLKDISASLKSSTFSSSAYGSSSFEKLCIPGRINFDILVYLRREYKEDSYKLDYIAEKYLGENKNPVTAQMMFEYFESGDPDKIRIVAEYCIQDTLLPQRLVDKLNILQNQLSMSNISCVPIKFINERGQTIKVFSLILKEARNQNYLIPTFFNYDSNKDESEDEEKSFVGATVKTPLVGAYVDPITVSDFASLYPSIMRAHNLCYTTIVLDDSYLNLPGVEYLVKEWEDPPTKKNPEPTKHKYTFVQNDAGLCPGILKNLVESRIKYKKLMKDATDPFIKEVYNKCQNAVKVTMNSVYGFLAAPLLKCKPIAATVTTIGREMIEQTSNFIESHYDASVTVYGDSVTGDTPLIIKYNELIYIKSIESLTRRWKPYEEFKKYDTLSNRSCKEQSGQDLTGYLIWMDKGWTPIKRVIRHKNNKTIYRIHSQNGIVDTTEDHSLLDSELNIIKPVECKKNKTDLLCSYPINNNSNSNNENNSFDINSRVISLEKTLNTLFNTGIASIEEAYILGLFDTKTLNSIDSVLNCNSEIMRSYLNGFLMNYTNKSVNKDGSINFINISGKVKTAKIYYILSTLYKNVIVTPLSMSMYNLQCNNNDQVLTNKIISVSEIQFAKPDYVYDIETESGRFLAGIGKTVVKNTDSVFVKYKTESSELYAKKYSEIYGNCNILNDNIDINLEKELQELAKLKAQCIKESMLVGIEASKRVTDALFKHPISLEYEKVYCGLLLLSKKRYMGDYYSNNQYKPDKRENKGVVLKRRDITKILKEVYEKVIDIIMIEGNYGVDKCIDIIKDLCYNIANNNVDFDKFIISKTLRNEYKNQNVPQLVVAKKIESRNPGSGPKSNDRVPYVIIEDLKNKKKMPIYTKVEDPIYAKEHNLQLDIEYYITNMMGPLCEVLSIFIENPEKIFKDIIKEYKETIW